MRVPAPALAVAVIAAACTAGPGPTPTDSPAAAPTAAVTSEPSARTPASPSATPRSTEPGTFDLTLGGSNGQSLPVRVVDETGLVLSVTAAASLTPIGDASGPLLLQGIRNPDGDETVLVYGWTGGACDRSTTLVFQRAGDGYRLSGTTELDPGLCILIALLRGVELQLAEPVPAASVTVGPPP